MFQQRQVMRPRSACGARARQGEKICFVNLWRLAAAFTLSAPAFGQQDQLGTAVEAKAMLEKAVFAVKADKAKALLMFNKGEGGFKDRDLSTSETAS
jgi:hypothetical protein